MTRQLQQKMCLVCFGVEFLDRCVSPASSRLPERPQGRVNKLITAAITSTTSYPGITTRLIFAVVRRQSRSKVEVIGLVAIVWNWMSPPMVSDLWWECLSDATEHLAINQGEGVRWGIAGVGRTSA
jgi:hypothetical protein